MIELAERLGMPLMPWQELLMNDACAVGPDGSFARKTVLTMISRQNGKTHLARMRIVAGLVLFGERNIIGLAQKLSMARETWLEVVDIFQRDPSLSQMVKTIRYANGQEELHVNGPNGLARYSIQAASRRARGLTADFVYVDELREVTSDAWESVTPFVTTTGGQIWATSNAGDITSEALNNLRANILGNPSQRAGLYEWSAPERAAIDDREGWAYANPSLGHPQLPHFTVGVLEDALRSSKPGAFRTERLCQSVLALNPAIPMESLEECTDTALVVTPDPNLPLYMAIDASPDSKRADLLVGQVRSDGRTALHVVRTWDHLGAIDDVKVANDIISEISVWNPSVIAYNQYATGNIGQRLESLGHPTLNVAGAAFAQACDELLSAVVHHRVIHAGDETFIQHFAHAVPKPAADGGWRLVRRESGGYISIACAAAMVMHLATKPQQTAGVFFG